MTNEIDFDKVNEYAKRLGIGAKGKKKDEFVNEVLDNIVGQYTENEVGMEEKEFETYKKQNQDMLQFYMDNKDYGQKSPEIEEEKEADVEEIEKIEEEEKEPEETEPEEVPIEEAAKETGSETEEKPVEEKKSTAKKEPTRKATVKKKAAVKKGEWTPGSSAQICFEVLKKAGKKGLTVDEGIKLATGQFETTNLESRVVTVFKAAVIRGIAKQSDDKYIAIA